MDPQAVNQQFDDPHLKAAVKRLRGGHHASPLLRAQLLARMAQLRHPPQEPQPQAAHSMRLAEPDAEDEPNLRLTPARTTRPRWPMALAAAVLLVIGGIAIQTYRHHLAEQEEYAEYYAANEPLLHGMIDAYEAGARGAPADPLASAADGPAAVAQDLRSRLGRYIPVVDFTQDGWKLQSVTITQMGEHRAAQWQLTRNGQTISVFSLPASALAGADEVDHYELVHDDYALAGYVKDGSLNCVVGPASSLSLEEATRLATRLRGT